MLFHTLIDAHLQLNQLQRGHYYQDATIGELRQLVQSQEERLNKMMLAIEAMAELHAEAGAFTGQEIQARMEEIDLRDGKRDGKVTPEVAECVQCQRPMGRNSKKCLYCGSQRPNGPGIVQ